VVRVRRWRGQLQPDEPRSASGFAHAHPRPPGAARFTVDSQAGRVPISLYIHGTNINDWGGRSRGQRLGRLGGNRWTAYNWETNASNAGADFQHQNDAFLGWSCRPRA